MRKELYHYLKEDGSSHEFHIPENFDLRNWSIQEVYDLLSLSMGETNWNWAKISFNHWDHLTKKLGIKLAKEPDSTSEFDFNYYINGSEGYLKAYRTNIGWSLLIYVIEDQDDHYPGKELLNMLRKSNGSFIHKGLHHMVDSNYGGFDHPLVLEIVSGIIFG